jgi:1,4-alpha-glucan branching enzyme
MNKNTQNPDLSSAHSLISPDDIYLFNEGSHYRIFEKLGAHLATLDGKSGSFFAVWAPNAAGVCVAGDFNHWSRSDYPLRARGQSGIWEGFIPGLEKGALYKYFITSNHGGYRVQKADPLAFFAEAPPGNASIVWDLGYDWGDSAWMSKRSERTALDAPVSIYEVHLGSWRRMPEENNRFLTYRELAPGLVDHMQKMGFTHLELMPVMEHPFYGSWGYQTSGYFSPTSRYGTPQDFMYFIDYLHQHDIGVILDWVPSHFPNDEHGLGFFDGTHLYEHRDPRTGIHPDWNSLIFNYSRNEVRSFLLSSAQFWLDKYHADGLRVDAVASMLYLDYSRKPGQWIPNKYGGRENLEAISFLRKLNEISYREIPGIQTIAEESTAWPSVSRPIYVGGLGFGFKWDMGWMHDTLEYMKLDPIYRKYQHGSLTFRMIYAHTENFILPLSHDEVVHGKGSLLGKMPGDDWQKFANMRLLLSYMFVQPGKKLLFMGDEFAQSAEWNHDKSLDWHLTKYPGHAGVMRWVQDLNRLYRTQPALYQKDYEHSGFEWIDSNDVDHSILSFLRKGRLDKDNLLVVCNFTPNTHFKYKVGIPEKGYWTELINSDAKEYGGSGQGNFGGTEAFRTTWHGRPYLLEIVLPPLSVLIFKRKVLDA